jgi:transcriptional regulator GlxA family with amidase domain
MRIAFVLYEGFTALDLVGPYEVLSRWPDADVRFLATDREPVRADMGLIVTPTDTPATLPDPDLVVVPGASDPLTIMDDEELRAWVQRAAKSATWMASVCSGAGIYAAAGLLEGRKTTTHWGFRENLKAMGITVVADRVVFDPPYVSGAGVSAGIDMALALTARVHGDELAKALQLGIEYDPEPLFDSGAPEKASPSTLRMALRILMRDQPNLPLRATRQIVTARARRARAAISRRS